MQAQAARSKRILEIKSQSTSNANEEMVQSETNGRIKRLEDSIELLEEELLAEKHRMDREVAAIAAAAKTKIAALEQRLADCRCSAASRAMS